MTTIVRYTDQHPACNAYPQEIISPTRPAACCFMVMEEFGEPTQEGQWLCRYRRCRTCGFTVRVAIRCLPDEERLAKLRRELTHMFIRNAPA